MIETIPLGDLYAQRPPSVNPARHQDEEFDLFSVPAYESGVPSRVRGIDIGSSKIAVLPGDVLLCRIVPHIRRAWVVPAGNGRRQIASGEWMVMRDDRAFPAYLRHLLLSDNFHRQFMTTVAGVGGSLMRARPGYAAAIEIPLPPLPEQRRIASILDSVDTQRTRRRQSIDQLRGFSTGLFEENFGSPSSTSWPVGRVSDLVEAANYGTSAKAGRTGTLPILRMGNLTSSGTLDLTDLKRIDIAEKDREKYLVHTDDVLFNRTNSAELVGKSARYSLTEPMAYAGYLVRLRPASGQSGHYIAGFLNSRWAKNHLRGMAKSIVGMANINAREVQTIPVPLPPEGIQDIFAALCERIDGIRSIEQSHLAKLDELFASLQYRAFRGEL